MEECKIKPEWIIKPDCTCAACEKAKEKQKVYWKIVEKQLAENKPAIVSGQPIQILSAIVYSQKAKGVRTLGLEATFDWLSIINAQNAYVFSSDFPAPNAVSYPTFARPCPTRPRHGFVDSRIIHTDLELTALVNEIREAGEDRIEILLQKPIAALWSAVWTPTTLTFGPGGDGATAGHNTCTIPLVSSGDCFYNAPDTRLRAGINCTLYCEIVSDGIGLPEVVQLRDGPPIVSTRDYIPDVVKVDSIVGAEGDLLEWEKSVKCLRKGTVVYHPGGSLSSHYAVHCILNKIPVVCAGGPPQIGTVLKPNRKSPRLLRRHYTEIAYSFATFLGPNAFTVETARKYLEIAFAVLHNYAVLDLTQRPHQNLFCFGAVTLIKCSTALLAGEMRHYESNGPYRHWAEKIPCPIKGIAKGGGDKRQQIYAKYLRHGIEYSTLKLPQLKEGFSVGHWDCSFGGSRWAHCAGITQELVRAIIVYMIAQKTRRESLREIVAGYNRLVHEVHNNGRLYNKILNTSIMNVIASAPVRGLLNNTTWEIINIVPSSMYPKAVGVRLANLLEQGTALGKELFAKRLEKAEAESELQYVDLSLLVLDGAQFKNVGQGTHWQIPNRNGNGYQTLNSFDVVPTKNRPTCLSLAGGATRYFEGPLHAPTLSAASRTLFVWGGRDGVLPIKFLGVTFSKNYVYADTDTDLCEEEEE